MKLVSTFPWSEEHLARLLALAPDVEFVCSGSAITTQQGISDADWARELPLFLQAVADADIVIGHFGSTVERLTGAIEERLQITGGGGIFLQLMRAAGQRLRWVHCTSAGVEKLLYPETLASPAILTCGKGEAAGSLLAETVMARVLLYTRGLLPAIESRTWAAGRSARWSELRGMTMGILGFGGAGATLARVAAAFGMDVIAIRRHPTPPPPGVRVGSSRVDLQACKLEYSIVSPK